jgi:hypothetical protein
VWLLSQVRNYFRHTIRTMGVDWFPCKGGCGGVVNDAGDFFCCAVCDAKACCPCGEHWHVICNDPEYDDDDHVLHVCDDCQEVPVTDDELFQELLRLYLALPGADPLMSADVLRTLIGAGRESAYAKWKHDNPDLVTASDKEAESEDATIAEEKAEPAAKRACV